MGGKGGAARVGRGGGLVISRAASMAEAYSSSSSPKVGDSDRAWIIAE